MNQEVIPVRSRNKNVFKHSRYWKTWSRVLFHDPAGGRGVYELRKKYNIPDCVKTIELDLTPINGFTSIWRDQFTDEAVIRRHCADIKDDRFYGSLPQEVYERMAAHYSERTMDLLLHADYLPYLDHGGKMMDTRNSTFKNLFMEPQDLGSYHAEVRMDGGPGILIEDVRDSWEAAVAVWNRRIKNLTPIPGENKVEVGRFRLHVTR